MATALLLPGAAAAGPPAGPPAGAPGERGLERAEEASGGRLAGPGASAPVKAGVATVDATWHVGATAGQYAHKYYDSELHGRGVDPHLHQTTAWPSYGLESRSDVRALVIEDPDGERIAFVANDLYIPQDLVNRRVATILEEHDARARLGLAAGPVTGISEENMTVAVSHSHTSVYLSTPSWGVWAFQDVFDIRFFEYIAQRMAEAVIAASADLHPVQMGAAEVAYSATHRHSYGPTVADDGTPAGYPETDNDHKVTVLRFDRLDTAGGEPEPLATWVTYGLHPEMLDGNDILSGEWVNAMYRMVDAETGGTTLFSQRNIGSAEPARSAAAHEPEARAEFAHKEYAQMTRAARLVSDAVLAGFDEAGRPEPARTPAEGTLGHVPPRSDFEVAIRDLRFAPPSLRLLPVVSSCRAEKAFAGNPGVPIAGLPDCEFPLEDAGGWPSESPFDPSVTYDTLREAGVPVPDNVPGPSYTGLQETLQVHLQAIRLGDVAITVCPCEQFADQSRNITTRLDRVEGNLWLGFDWTDQTTPHGRDWCVPGGDGTWTCANPRTGGTTDLAPVSDDVYRRMVAQVNNDAAGWDRPENSLRAESEPTDPDQIWGNFTHEELGGTDEGYEMIVPIGMANDYWGYIVSYREFQAHDHYRKALTGLGPHSMDFFATRLSRMAWELKGGPAVELGPKDLLYTPENEHQRNRARLIGEIAERYLPAYAATLPPDGGSAGIVGQPDPTVERFDAVTLEWVGGSNWFDLPEVLVERWDADAAAWLPFGDTTGHVQVKVTYPNGPEEVAAWRAGRFEWHWQANVEVFSSDVTLPDASGGTFEATPPGTYRLRVLGQRHLGLGDVEEYELVSSDFAVDVWRGIEVASVTADAATDTVTVDVGTVDYPDWYDDPVFDEFIEHRRDVVTYPGGHVEEFCFHCTFRPWADTGLPQSVTVTVAGESAVLACSSGTCTGTAELDAGDSVVVPAGGVRDRYGNRNAEPASATAR